MLSLTAILSMRCMGVMGVVVLVAMAILAVLVAMLMGRGMAWHGRRGAARTRAGRVIESDGRPNASDSSFGHRLRTLRLDLPTRGPSVSVPKGNYTALGQFARANGCHRPCQTRP